MTTYKIAVPEEQLVSLKIKLGQAEFPDEVDHTFPTITTQTK